MTDDLISKAVLEWARREFTRQIDLDFRTAGAFDGILSQIVVAGLKRFSRQELEILATVLPLGVASTGPSTSALRNQLPPEQRQLVERFQDATCAVRSERWSEYADQVHRMNSPDGQEEARSIVNTAGVLIKELAAEWKFVCAKLEPAVWKLAVHKQWGELSVQFDFGAPLRLHYGVSVYDRFGNPLRRHDHFLGVLGIGPSMWAITTAKECRHRLLKASELVRWHVTEYERILEPVLSQ